MMTSSRGAPHCIAVVRFSAAGDVILTASVVAALAKAWPQSRIIFVTHERYAPLMRHNPMVSEICALAPKESLRSLIRRLRALGVDALCDLHGSLRSRGLSFGLGLKRRSRLSKQGLYHWTAFYLAHAPYQPTRPMEQRYHRAAEALVCRALPREPLIFHTTQSDHSAADRMLQRVGADLSDRRPMVALLPGAAWATKRWPVPHGAALARRLLDRGLQVLIMGSAQEAELTRAIAAAAPGSLDLGQKMAWGTQAQLLARCSAAVAGDTGPMHLARAVGTRCVVLFGSTPASQFDLRGHEVLVSEEHCSPCSSHGLAACPRGHLRCMRNISVEQVWQALEGILAHCLD